MVTSSHPQFASSVSCEAQPGRRSRLRRHFPEVQSPPGSRHGLIAVGLAFTLTLVFGLSGAFAQDQRKRKIPVVDKLTSGANHQAFSGKVETLDLERHVLEVNASEGKSLEIFPIKKSIQVSTADGGRLKLKELTPGTSIIIYYEQKGDQRTVKEIVVLAAGPEEKKPKNPPPS